MTKEESENLFREIEEKIGATFPEKEYMLSWVWKNKIEAITVREWGRFWNQIVQLVNAIYFAKKTNIQIIHLSWHPSFMIKKSVFLWDILVTCNKNAIKWKMYLEWDFFYLERYLKTPIPVEEYLHIHNDIFKILLKKSFKKNTFWLLDDDLVIHIRSGDIFSTSAVHSGYAQPPLAYYKKVIDYAQPKRVIIVYEDTKNPCIEALQKYLSEKWIIYKNFSEELGPSIALLLDAKNICSWRGSFVREIIYLSPKIKKNGYFYKYFDITLHPRLCAQFEKIYSLKEKNEDYRNNVLRNWKNTDEQRKKMIEYIEGDFQITIIDQKNNS